MHLSFDRFWIWIAIALPAFVALLVPLPAVDLAYQVRAGNEILATGAIPGVDTWTFTVWGTPWVDQQWLAQVLLALGHGIGGWELLAVLRAGLIVGAFGLLLATAVERSAPVNAAAALTLVAFLLAAPALALRPQLFGIAVFAALLYLVAARQRRPGLYLLAPVLVVLWANVHGSFVLAPLLLGYAVVDDLVRGRPLRRSLLVLALGTAATLANPFGMAGWAYAANIGSNPLIAGRISEWQRTSPLTVPGALFYASVVAVGGLFLARGRDRDRVSIADWLWIIGWAAIGAWTVRGLAWWPLAAVFAVAPIVVPAVSTGVSTARHRPRPNTLNTVVAIVLGLAIVAALPWWRKADPLTGRQGLLSYAPSGLAQAMTSRLPTDARVFTHQTWASWFEWAVADVRYFLDSRFELFPGEVFTTYDGTLLGGESALAHLDEWHVTIVAIDPDAPLAETLDEAGWQRMYEDDEGILFGRPGNPP
jgi:hypothetical protein